MGDDNYFQFPLCALAFCDSERERLDEIISFAFVDAGFAMLKKVAPEIRKSLGDDLKGRQGTPADNIAGGCPLNRNFQFKNRF